MPETAPQADLEHLDPGVETLWLAAMEEWRVELPKPSFEAWLKPTVLLDLSDSRALVGVPTDLAKAWLEDRYAEMMATTLSGMLGTKVVIEVAVVQAGQPAEVPAAELLEGGNVVAFPQASALMEYTLSRRAIWETSPDRSQLEYRYETEDVEGKITIDYSMGALSTAELELVAYALGQWDERSDAPIPFALRQYVRDSGVVWSGRRAKLIKEQLARIKKTTFEASVWDPKTRQRTHRIFGIFDDVKIRDKATSLDDPGGREARIAIVLSTFIREQLRARQFVRLDWGILRGGLKTPLARRLYVFLEGQKGFGPTGDYSISIDDQFLNSLGSKDLDFQHHGSRFRKRLLAAGAEIVGADARYLAIEIKPGKRTGWVLVVRREARARVVASQDA